MIDNGRYDPGRRRLWVALFVLISLGFVVGGFLFYRSETNRIQLQKSLELKTIAEFKANQIGDWRLERLAQADRTAASPFFVRGIEDWLRHPDTPGRREDLKKRLRLEQRYDKFADVCLISTNGRIVFSLSERPDPIDVADVQAITEATRRHQAVLSYLYRSRSGRVYIDAVAPVADAAGRPLGVILFRSDAKTFLYPLIESWPTPSRTAETLMVRKDGRNILFLNDLRHRANTALSLSYPLNATDTPAVQAVLGKEGAFRGKDYRGVEVLADLRPIPGSPWFMVAKVDTAEILAEARYRAVVVFLGTLFLILLTASTIAYIYRHRQAYLFKTLYHAEQEQREAHELFRTTLYSIGDAVITTDASGEVKHMNRVAERLTGWQEGEAQRKPLPEVFPIVNEYTRAGVANPVERILREGNVIGLANHTVLIAKDGREYPIADSGAPIHDEKGAIIGAVMVFRDRTEERRAQQALKESKASLDLALQSASMGVWHWDLKEDKRYFDDQACRLLGIEPAAFTGTPDEFFDVVHPDDREMLKTALSRTIERDVPYEPAYRAVWPDGSVHYIAARGRIVRDDADRPERINGIIWDITEHKIMEELLRRSVKEREILIEEIHHRVKNNLQVISSMISLQSDYVEDGRIKELFQESVDRVNSMARIHARLYQSGDYSHIDFGNHVRDLCAQLYASYRLDTDSIALDISAEDISVNINTAIPLSLIINELLSNAMKHAFPGGRKGTITVALRARLGEAAVSVSDTGIGFPDSLDFRTTGSLGLQLVVQLVDQIGGSIEMSSREGTTFLVTFPVAP